MTDALGFASSTEYDNLGRVIKETGADPDGAGSQTAPETTYAYDAVGNVVSQTDALGNVTSFEYDDLYRRTMVIQADPDGAGSQTAPITLYGYRLSRSADI